MATNERLIFIRIDLTGQTVEDYMWRNVVSVQSRQGVRGRKFCIVYGNGFSVEVDGLPRKQISCLYRVSKDMRVPCVS